MIFRALSIFGPGGGIQLLKKAATPAGDCFLCQAPAGHERVCAACVASLPLAGPACPRCALPMARDEACGRCLRAPPAFDAALAAFEYRFPIDRLVQRFKFAGDLAIGRWLGERLAAAVHAQGRPDLLVAPPLTPARLRERGFNQAVELARAVARDRRVPLELAALRRVRETAPQPGLGRRARRENLQWAFAAQGRWPGAHVALVDDVMTTGATAEALAQALKAAGAARVSVWVLARTPADRT